MYAANLSGVGSPQPGRSVLGFPPPPWLDALLREGFPQGADRLQFAVIVAGRGVVPEESVGGLPDDWSCAVFPPPLVGLSNLRELDERLGGQAFGAAFFPLLLSASA